MNTTTPAIKSPEATGNPWLPMPDDPATVPVPLPVLIVSVDGPYTEQDRKLWIFLLHAVWNELEEKAIHELRVRDIKQVFRDHNVNWIWDSSERLADTKVRWIRTEGDRRYKGISSLFSAEVDDESRDTGILRFSFPSLLIPILKDPHRFARLRTHFMIELSGKYAVTLYELLESVANKDIPMLESTVEELRNWLKVPKGKLERWQDLRRRALEPGLKQINDNKEAAGLHVTMRPIKIGRAITRVRFEVSKTEQREELDEKLSDKQIPLFGEDSYNPRLKQSTLEAAKKIASGWDIYALEAEWRNWGRKRKGWPPDNPDGAFINFCKKRGPYPGS